MKTPKLHKRIFDLSYKHKLSHVGSCISAVDIIYNILSKKREEDIFILSSGHAGLAYYVVLESLYGFDAEKLFKKHGVHPNRDLTKNIHVSTGSLGIGILIGIGTALANKERTTYCLLSDGECSEGSVWEALRFVKENKIKNIKIYINMNGFSAYRAINKPYLKNALKSFLPSIIIKETKISYTFLKGIDAHYYILKKEDYRKL